MARYTHCRMPPTKKKGKDSGDSKADERAKDGVTATGESETPTGEDTPTATGESEGESEGDSENDKATSPVSTGRPWSAKHTTGTNFHRLMKLLTGPNSCFTLDVKKHGFALRALMVLFQQIYDKKPINYVDELPIWVANNASTLLKKLHESFEDQEWCEDMPAYHAITYVSLTFLLFSFVLF